MLVETYEVPETEPGTGLVLYDETAIALVEQMGLKGQKKLISGRTTDSGETVKTLLPYREMTAQEIRVYEHLLQERTPLIDYDRGPIPLRVLQIAAVAHREQWFEKMVVWHPTHARDKDPLLVGVRTVNWDDTWYLMARWGEVLEPFEVLLERAKQQWITRVRSNLEQRLAAIEGAAQDYFNGIDPYGYE